MTGSKSISNRLTNDVFLNRVLKIEEIIYSLKRRIEYIEITIGHGGGGDPDTAIISSLVKTYTLKQIRLKCYIIRYTFFVCKKNVHYMATFINHPPQTEV